MATTIHDIAKKAGVSPSTVSRAINGKTVISAETREKIFAIMEDLDFHPNSLARNLARGNAGAIALIMDAEDPKTFSNQFFTHSVFGIERIAQDKGFNLIITRNSDAANSSLEQIINEKKADGLIIPPSLISKRLIQKLQQQKFPFVVLGEPPLHRNSLCWVDIHNEQGGELAVSHLVEKGYRSIAFIGESQRKTFIRNRISGFQKTIADFGLQAVPEWIVAVENEPDKVFQAVLSCFQAENRPDALVCSDNMIAFSAIKALKSLELRIPQQVGMVTFDNYPLAQFTEPALTAIDVDTNLLGEKTAALLLQTIEDYSIVQQTLVGTKLFPRESSDRG